MPLLALETYLYPDDLLERSVESAGSESWWVLHTKPRAEKALARRFLEKQASFYLPVHHRQWRSRGRLYQSYLPLFPGYVFLYGDREARLASLETNLVAYVLPVDDQRQLHTDLCRVQALIAAGAPITPEDRLEPGDPVSIIKGPFAGMEGKLIRRGKHMRFIVEVQFLRRAVSAEVESWMIQPSTSIATPA